MLLKHQRSTGDFSRLFFFPHRKCRKAWKSRETSCSKGKKIKLKNCWIFFIKFFFRSRIYFTRRQKRKRKSWCLFLVLEKFEAELNWWRWVTGRISSTETSKSLDFTFSMLLLMLTTSRHKTFILWWWKLIFSVDKLHQIMASSERHRNNETDFLSSSRVSR